MRAQTTRIRGRVERKLKTTKPKRHKLTLVYTCVNGNVSKVLSQNVALKQMLLRIVYV